MSGALLFPPYACADVCPLPLLRLLHLFHSYYGGLSCVSWTPDGKYVLTGGQDDLISIWSLADSALVARCEGHQSWVSALAFDPWRCDSWNYRFGSVGEDGRLCLWDFGVGMLHRPKVGILLQQAPSCWGIHLNLCKDANKRRRARHDKGPPSRSRPSSLRIQDREASSNLERNQAQDGRQTKARAAFLMRWNQGRGSQCCRQYWYVSVPNPLWRGGEMGGKEAADDRTSRR